MQSLLIICKYWCATVCSLDKFNLTVFKMLYLLYYMSCFKVNLQDMLRELSHTKCYSLLKFEVLLLKYISFSRGLFFHWRTLYVSYNLFVL